MRYLQLMAIGLLMGCSSAPPTDISSFPSPQAPRLGSEFWPSDLARDQYYDKLLGVLVGSAIGDAMGAPVEMWSRQYIEVQYGFIDTLVAVRRSGQAEGPWEDNLVAGGTTDDTRWKYLVGQYLLTQSDTTLDDRSFAQLIVDLYQRELKEVQSVETFDPEPLEKEFLQVQWLQEWAKVAKPYADDDLREYSYAVNRFYGGELACAGMLYSPMLGAFFPGQADRAYLESYKLGLFDLGYARDISALTAAYVSKSMQPGVTLDDVAAITQTTDPLRYFNSRLVERIAYRSYTLSKEIVYEVNKLESMDADLEKRLPKGYKGTALDHIRLMKAYELLEQHLQDIPFHAGEIHLINLTALAYGEGDFRKTMNFIVNFGRDNDTVAAVTGAILGGYLGYSALPDGLKKAVLTTSKDVMGIDLELLAEQLTSHQFPEG